VTEPDVSADDSLPLRVSTLELFFDLVFVFAITQLTGILAEGMTAAGVLRVLLVFGVLWWIYGGYVWLSSARAPARTPERLLMLVDPALPGHGGDHRAGPLRGRRDGRCAGRDRPADRDRGGGAVGR
jgi:hypothetical protein